MVFFKDISIFTKFGLLFYISPPETLLYLLCYFSLTNAQIEESRNAFASLPSEEIMTNFTPIPACKQDFSLMKLTSFDKLLETTGSFLTNVRLFSEQDVKSIGTLGNSGMAPDAA